MKKRLIALLIVCVMLVAALAGCGAKSDKIRIGGIAPLTGSVSIYGIAADNGAAMAAAEYGKVLDKEIEFIHYDDKGDETEAVNAYNKLVQNDGVVAVVGAVTSAPSIAVAQKAVTDNTPIISGTASALAFTTKGDNVFRACFTDPTQGELMALYAAKELGAKTAAIIYDNASDYSVGLTEAFEATAAANGVQIVAKESYMTGDTDFKAQLTNINGKNPDILFIPDYYETVALVAVQAKDIGITATKIGGDGWEGVLDKLDASNVDALENSYYPTQFTAQTDNQKCLDFYANYKAKYGEDPSMFAALGYDAMMMMLQSIDQAGSTDSAKVIEAMKNIQYDGVTGSIVFDAERNPQKTVTMIKIAGGAYTNNGTFGK